MNWLHQSYILFEQIMYTGSAWAFYSRHVVYTIYVSATINVYTVNHGYSTTPGAYHGNLLLRSL